MKKVVSILVCLLLIVASVSAFAAGEKVGVSMPTKDLQRWNQDGANMQAMLEAAGYTVDLQFASNDVQT
ncbi:MAG: ABC transporter substrate-binding protein, partial [Spirochaetales bacterium]|nr:ABC transporter substrate-binding protein [Spirochaetales bacterium]